MAAVTCPHCTLRTNVTFFPRAGRVDDPMLDWIQNPKVRQFIMSQEGNVRALIDSLDQILSVSSAEGKREKWRIGRCQGCKMPLFLIVSENEEDILKIYPTVSLEPPKDLPSGVADDYVEGTLCLSVGAHKAAVSMFRRALQGAAIDKGSTKDKLFKQLDELGTRGLLNDTLLDVAHQVRHFGNFGAHPDKDELGEVHGDEAEAIKQLTWQVLEDLYVNPRKRDEMKSAIAAKKKPKAPKAKAAAK